MSPVLGWGTKGKAEATWRPRLPGPDKRPTGQEGAQNAPQTRTDLKLPLDPPFAALTEVHLGLVVLGHHLHKLPGQDGVLWGQGQGCEPPGARATGSAPRPQPRPQQHPTRGREAKGSSWQEGRLCSQWGLRFLRKLRVELQRGPTAPLPGVRVCVNMCMCKICARIYV